MDGGTLVLKGKSKTTFLNIYIGLTFQSSTVVCTLSCLFLTLNPIFLGLVLNFTATWGDPYYLGLTGMEVVGRDAEPLPVSMNMLDADPRDLHVLPGYERDDRTLDK